MQIKTISTVDGVNEINFSNDSSHSTAHFYWLKNLGNSTLYVSAKPDLIAEKDDVAELPVKGAVSVETDEEKVYILGAGKVEIHNTDSKFCPFELPSTGSGGGSSIIIDSALSETSRNPAENKVITGAINDLSSRMLNPNLLINPDFRINQRAASGTISTENGILSYFVDRWVIVDGSVTINSDGTLTLNGTISQFLENTIKSKVTVSSSAGKAVYDEVLNAFEITGNGDIISWAKLEYGDKATPFIPPNITEEQIKCQRYYLGLSRYIRYPMTRYTTNDIDFIIPTNAMFRVMPTLSGDPVVYAPNSTTAQSGFTFSIVNAIAIRATKTNHGLTSAYLEVTNGVAFNAEI